MKREYIVPIDFIGDPPENKELVRCKNCKHQVDHGRKYKDCDIHFLQAKDEWFCADGERKMEIPSKEKVIKGLEIQLDDLQKYADSDEILTLTQEQAKEIVTLLNLLKEQETETIECEMCGHRLQTNWNWCPWCRWETALRKGQ